MFLRSDNIAGADPAILEAINACNAGTAEPYGGDRWSARLDDAFGEVFGTAVRVFPVTSGTAANSLALASAAGPFDLIVCHDTAHARASECGATETQSGGARFQTVGGGHGRIDIAAARAALDAAAEGGASAYRPRALSVTQLTEAGTCYDIGALNAVGALAREYGVTVHMDGARLANALVSLDASPGDATWRCGVDVLSFGGTKNGTMGADAVVFFDPALADGFARRLKRAGQAISKSRFLAAQLLRYIGDGLWLHNARHANTQARRLAAAMAEAPGVRIVHPVDGNIVFASLDERALQALARDGFAPRVRSTDRDGRKLVRLVTSFATPVAEIEAFAAALPR